MRVLWMVVPLVVGGCLFNADVGGATISCVRDEDCPDGTTCATILQLCLDGAAAAGDVCGDGIVSRSGREACDDGAANSDDTPDVCRADCTLPRCGDGVLDRGEGCDDNNTDDNDECTSFCAPNTCGDGVVQVGAEECDDGDGDFDDDCLPNCRLNVCGDGFLLRLPDTPRPPERCDDGNTSSGDACLASCEPNVCGDGVVNLLGEQCDDGDADNADGCLASCARARCGDGVVDVTNPAEQCDDGNAGFDDACLPDCRRNVCGDGFLLARPVAGELGEACDDGNLADDDSCLGSCQENVCGDGVLNPLAEECDDGDDDDNDACRTLCLAARCGDGVVNAEAPAREGDPLREACDDGNPIATDDCLSSCIENRCGDGVVQLSGTDVEVCDDGNTESGDGCSASCSLVIRTLDVGAPLVSAATIGALSGDDHVVVVAVDAAGRAHFVDLDTGEHLVVDVGGAPLLPPAGEVVSLGFVPRVDGSAAAWLIDDLPVDAGTRDAGTADAGTDFETLPLLLETTAFFRQRVRVFDVAAGPPGLILGGGTVAMTGATRFAATIEGALVQLEAGEARTLVPAGGEGAVAGPTAVVDGTRAPVGVFSPRGRDLRYRPLLLEPATDPDTGAPILDPIDGGVVGGVEVDGGFTERLVPCAAPAVSAPAGEVVGQVVVTDRGELVFATTGGQVVRSTFSALSCPIEVGPPRIAELDGPALGAPVVTVDPLTGLTVAFVATGSGVQRVIFPDRAEPTAQTLPTTSSPVGPLAINRNREVLFGTIDGRLIALDEDGETLFEVPLAAPVVGAPLVLDEVVVIATANGVLMAIERGGQVPSVSAGDDGIWFRSPGGDLCGSSAARIEPERDGGCASAGCGSALSVLALVLSRRRRRRLHGSV